MNELEQLIDALDSYERLKEIEDQTNIFSEEKPFIFENDIVSMKNFLKQAYYQLNNREIEIRNEV